jgi:hypothetical protein
MRKFLFEAALVVALSIAIVLLVHA